MKESEKSCTFIPGLSCAYEKKRIHQSRSKLIPILKVKRTKKNQQQQWMYIASALLEGIPSNRCIWEHNRLYGFYNFFSFERLFGTLKIQIQHCLQTLLRIITINAKNNSFHKFLRSLTFRYDRRMDAKKFLKFKEKQKQPNNWFISQN